jgi:hypothetical protein
MEWVLLHEKQSWEIILWVLLHLWWMLVKIGMFCEKVAAWQICEKWKKLGLWGCHSLDLFKVYAIHYTSCHYLVHPINEFSKPNYFHPFPYQPTWIQKRHINFTFIIICTTSFQIPFQNVHLLYHCLYLFVKDPLKISLSKWS